MALHITRQPAELEVAGVERLDHVALIAAQTLERACRIGLIDERDMAAGLARLAAAAPWRPAGSSNCHVADLRRVDRSADVAQFEATAGPAGGWTPELLRTDAANCPHRRRSLDSRHRHEPGHCRGPPERDCCACARTFGGASPLKHRRRRTANCGPAHGAAPASGVPLESVGCIGELAVSASACDRSGRPSCQPPHPVH